MLVILDSKGLELFGEHLAYLFDPVVILETEQKISAHFLFDIPLSNPERLNYFGEVE